MTQRFYILYIYIYIYSLLLRKSVSEVQSGDHSVFVPSKLIPSGANKSCTQLAPNSFSQLDVSANLINSPAKSWNYPYLTFNNLPDHLVSIYILNYLNMQEVAGVCLLNKNAQRLVKMHLCIRYHIEYKIVRSSERANVDFSESIKNKRNVYYHDYEVEVPDKDVAIGFIETLTPSVYIYIIYILGYY